jgi:hypothetical protein
VTLTTTSSPLTIVVNSVVNPPSLKPTGRFSFSSGTSDGFSYALTNSTITATNTQPSNWKSINGTFSNLIYGSANNLTLHFTPTNSITGWIIITIANSFTLTTLQCLSFSGVCSPSGSTMNISGSFNTGSNTLLIGGLVSPNTVPTDATSVSSYDISGFLIDSGPNVIQFTANCTLPCRTCDSATSCTSCYTSASISTRIYFYATNSSCLMSCPSSQGLFTDTANFQCLPCSSPCFTCAGSVTNCTSCVSTSIQPYLNISSGNGTCLNSCVTGMYPDTTQSIPVCVACVTPCSTCTSLKVCLTCISPFYMYLGNCTNTCPDNITIVNTVSRTCDACASVCAYCQGNTANCTKCAATAALYNGLCVS